MIHYAEIRGEQHPFKIGMREHQLMYRNAIKIDADINDLKGMSQQEAEDSIKIDLNEVISRVVTDFDTFLQMFALASKKGCRHHEREEGEAITPLSEVEIEDAIDEDPELYDRLMQIFVDSNTTETKSKKKAQKKP